MLIVDANIVFSGIVNTNGNIGDLLINSDQYFTFIAPDFLRIEIRSHYPRLMKVSKMTLEQIQEAEFQIYKGIVFISGRADKRFPLDCCRSFGSRH